MDPTLCAADPKEQNLISARLLKLVAPVAAHSVLINVPFVWMPKEVI